MREIKKAIIPVAGLGTRFLPATKAQPKEMLPLVDKPVIQYVVEEVASAGILSIVFVTGRGKQAIENHFDVSYELEQLLRGKGRHDELDQVIEINRLVQFAYVRQGEALGLGHAIQCARFLTNNDPVAVLLGDDVFESSAPAIGALMQAYEQTGMSVVGVQEVPAHQVDRYGIVSPPKIVGENWAVDTIVEKPHFSVAPSSFAVVGRYILTPEVFEILEKIPLGHGGEYQLTDALAILAGRGRLMATRIEQKRFDTGNKFDYLKASIEFALNRKEFSNDLKKYIIKRAQEFTLNDLG